MNLEDLSCGGGCATGDKSGDVSKEFRDTILKDLLPEFCNAPKRGWGCEGFNDRYEVSEKDSADFLIALKAGLVEHLGDGLYAAPRSGASEQFFWSGRKNVSPRPVTLWLEPIITLAVLSRLHFEWGWPKEQLGTQSPDWEFDVIAYRHSDTDNEYLACEIKKTPQELDQLVHFMHLFATDPDRRQTNKSRKETNAFRKLQGLEKRRAPVFWAVGPGGYHKVFRMRYPRGCAVFECASDEALEYISES